MQHASSAQLSQRCCWAALNNGALQATEQVAEEQKEATARTAKMRTLGNIRLIAELFKKSVVPEKIVLVCVQDLIGDPKQEPSENNVEVWFWLGTCLHAPYGGVCLHRRVDFHCP